MPPCLTKRPCCCPTDDNELLTLEIIHHFVEVLDKYFKNVCELDLIFNFHKVGWCRELWSAGLWQNRCSRGCLVGWQCRCLWA